MDAPARVKLTLGEVPGEVAQPFDPHPGWLSRGWQRQ
jgi:alpha-L-rhamnosidase